EQTLITEANALITDMDSEIQNVYQFVRDHYQPKFPGLDSLIAAPMDFIRVVQAIGNTMDITKVNLENILTPSMVMVVTVSATTAKGVSLPEAELQRVREACDMALALDAARSTIVSYIESRLNAIAPNLSAVIGTVTAAKLLAMTGGLAGLCRLPASTVMVLGTRQQRLATGMSKLNNHAKAGHIYHSPEVQSIPTDLRIKALRMLSAKAVLAARIDLNHSYLDGEMGRRMREDVDGKIKVLREPPPSKKVKPLPAPLEAPKKRRGGRRARREKDSRAMSELRKQQNRLAFGETEQEMDYVDEESVGLGMIGQNSNRARIAVPAPQSKGKL
ncbi:hypothetical protein BJ085DRAFT_6738, partial [Dimargaris cristalligena]